MDKIIENVVLGYYKTKPVKTHNLGGGFYGRVFLAEIDKEPYNIIAKIYLFPNLAEKEALQINTLSKYSLIKMPQIYYVYKSDDKIPNDVLLMEYVDGVNAGTNELTITEKNRVIIAEEIISNLLSYHNTINKDGFGDLDSLKFEPNWNNYYKKKAEAIMMKAERMHGNNKITEKMLNIMMKAIKNYEKIFYLPIETARLIHGDYNTWNILLNKELNCVSAIIDPMNCSWADSELDLFQLNNANGIYYGLLDMYKSKMKLSDNYRIKISFYELFSEVMHFHDANIDTSYNIKRFDQEADALNENMNIYGL